MKMLLVMAMLVLMGERWEYSHKEQLTPCIGDTTPCFAVYTDHYRRVYVIGEIVHPPGGTCVLGCERERFTIPVPNVPTKAMTKEEAEKANREGQ